MEAITLSTYEIERGKAMPSKNHAKIQGRLVTQLSNQYGEQYDVLSEISVDLPSGGAVPDVALYEPMPYDPFGDEVEMATPPLCAIEIISPSQSNDTFVKKAARYNVLLDY